MTRYHVRMSAALLAIESRPTEDLGDETSDVLGVLPTHLGEERSESGVLSDLPIEGASTSRSQTFRLPTQRGWAGVPVASLSLQCVPLRPNGLRLICGARLSGSQTQFLPLMTGAVSFRRVLGGGRVERACVPGPSRPVSGACAAAPAAERSHGATTPSLHRLRAGAQLPPGERARRDSSDSAR